VGLLARIPWRRALRCFAATAAVLAAGAAAAVLSGVYNVAATVPHFAVTEGLLEVALRRSVALHSSRVRAPDLSDPGLIRLGANHFQLGCAPCHGSPAAPAGPVTGAMYPEPPSLSHAAAGWDDAELFWIVKHGIKMTGMPAWAGSGRDGEVWAVAAFVRALPGMDAAEYAALTGAEAGGSPADLGLGGPPGDVCAACHGGEGAPPVHPMAPALEGQKAAYLARALREYRSGRRESGMMEPVAAALGSDEVAARLAGEYAGRPRPPGDVGGDPESVRRGRAIAEEGVAADGVPACRACHSGGTDGNFPLLDGLSHGYLVGQLELFRAGLRDETAYGAIMTAIAPRLSEGQVGDVAAYFASRPGQPQAAQ
jgi:cytochrome c553